MDGWADGRKDDIPRDSYFNQGEMLTTHIPFPFSIQVHWKPGIKQIMGSHKWSTFEVLLSSICEWNVKVHQVISTTYINEY